MCRRCPEPAHCQPDQCDSDLRWNQVGFGVAQAELTVTVPAPYQARLQTLASFAQAAADIYDTNPTTGTAKYEVARQQTVPIFDALNAATGTRFSLP